jgi:phosphoenolpyruvate carboxykinase (ATP)
MVIALRPLESILRNALRNTSVPQLYELALQTGSAELAQGGSLVVSTGAHTGRSPQDRFIVEQPASERAVDWNDINQPISQENADRLHDAVLDHLEERNCFVQDLDAGADPSFRVPIRVVTPSAWHALFAETMFIRPPAAERIGQEPLFTVLHAPEFEPDPAEFGLRTSTFIVVDFDASIILIGGTQYAGEIKKSIFSVMNFLLPERGVLPMHCSCNAGIDGNVALFFGLSGTGKTTLSADPDRILIGDDEHGWSERGVFNFEGGCYAKVISLREEHEPEIYATTHMFGTILENVVLDSETRTIDFDDDRYTENTRAVYPISSIPNASPSGVAGHPSNVIMLTADAFGVLPPVARLSSDQALYYFLSGYTSKVAGTEIGVDEPEATFSAGFGAPFLPRHPAEYAELLASRLEQTGAQAWLVNTGWTGGPYGTGERMPIEATRAIVTSILNGTLREENWASEPALGLSIPSHCPGVPDALLSPRDSWSNLAAYDQMAAKLSRMFAQNFAQFASQVSAAVADAGPRRS